MIRYPEVDPKTWAKRYNLKPQAKSCVSCGRTLTPSIPFMTLRYAGLIVEDHGCPQHFRQKIMTKLNEKEKQEMEKLVKERNNG